MEGTWQYKGDEYKIAWLSSVAIVDREEKTVQIEVWSEGYTIRDEFVSPSRREFFSRPAEAVNAACEIIAQELGRKRQIQRNTDRMRSWIERLSK